MIGPLIWYQICNCNHYNFEEILNCQFSKMSLYSWICPYSLHILHVRDINTTISGGSRCPKYHYKCKSRENAPFQITVLFRFSSVWFSLVTVLLIVCPRSLLLCPFHKKLRIWWKKSFGFCQTDNPRSSLMMYCYSTDLNVYTWVELTYQNRQVFWIQFLT